MTITSKGGSHLAFSAIRPHTKDGIDVRKAEAACTDIGLVMKYRESGIQRASTNVFVLQPALAHSISHTLRRPEVVRLQ
jgi:hypothetical protein